MDCDETLQDITEGCFGLDIANGKHPSPEIRVVQVPLRLIIQGEARNGSDKSGNDAATCSNDVSPCLSAGNQTGINQTSQHHSDVHGGRLPDQCCCSNQHAT